MAVGRTGASLLRQGVGWVDAVTAYWLGHALPVADRAVRSSTWAPDRSDAYCGRCGDTVGEGERTSSGCGACRDRPGVVDGIVRLGPYAGDLREWILDVKYRCAWVEMATALGRRLGDAVRAADAVDPGRTIVVPMPMPWSRRAYRGMDHARIVAEAVAGRIDAPVVDALKRRGGRPQVALPRHDRVRAGGRGLGLRWAPRPRPAGRTVILVDDVRTTGSSLRAAGRLLRTLGPDRITAAVLAVADDPARRRREPPGRSPAGGRVRVGKGR
jgi:predicted amidophosphoribosyltransferase